MLASSLQSVSHSGGDMVSVQRTHHIYMGVGLLFYGIFIYVTGCTSDCEDDISLSSKGRTNMMFIGVVMFIAACMSALRFRSPTEEYSFLQQRPRNLLGKQLTSRIKKDSQLLSAEILNIIIYIFTSFIFSFFLAPDVHSSLMQLWHQFIVNTNIFTLEDCMPGVETFDWLRYVLIFFLVASVIMVLISVYNFFLIFQAYRMNVHLKKTLESSDAEGISEEMQVMNSPDQPPAYEP